MSLIDPTILRQQIAAGFQSKLPAAIEDATAEAVQAFAESHVMHELAPYIAGDVMSKAAGGALAKLDQRTAMPMDPKGLLYDPFTAMDQLGFRERPTAVTYQTLGMMARRTPPVAAILQTRINQIASFAVPQIDDHSIGFRIRMRDKQAAMTPSMEKRARELEQWLLKCGNPDVKIKRPRLEKWLRMHTWDTLAYDQVSTEVVPDRKGVPSYWRALDAATIRISDDLDETDDTDSTIQYVQVYDDTIIAEFTDNELLFGVRNPRSDIKMAGYGQSELEMLITTVTALLNGIDYNAKFFTQGSVAKGMINFKGAVPEKELINFRRQWYSMLSGVENAWRTPIVNAEDVQWLNMQTSSRDMEWSAFIDWLLKITCAVYQIAPEEIGFTFGNTGQTGSMGDGNGEWKLQQSKDKGLAPLAKFTADELDRIIERIDPRFTVEFVGINARTATEQIDFDTKEVKALKTVNEKRAERDLDPIDGGDIILDPTFLQNKQAMAATGGEDGGGGPELDQGGLMGGPGEPPGQEDPDPEGDKAQDENGDGYVNPAVSDQDGGERVAKSENSRRILTLEVDV